MATQRWILVLPLAAMISLIAGCGGSTANVQNPPPPPPSNLAIAFQPEPGGSLAVGFSENITAVVTNDPNNYGVDWSLACQNPPNCGTLSPLHTASGSATTYTAPTTISTNTMDVEIVALATANHATNVVAPITISTFDSNLQAGNYVLQVQGIQNSTPYQLAGVITLDGQGNVTGGEQFVNSNGVSVPDNILSTGSSYFVGSDGRGTITLNTGDNNIGGNGIETFAFVFLNNGQNPQALISQIDLSEIAFTGASATGTMDLQQTNIAPPSGSYVFVLNGTDVLDKSVPLAFGGVFVVDSDQTTITGVTDEIIKEAQKLSDSPFASGSKISSGPDTFGQVTFTLLGILGAGHPKPVSIVLTGYIVDPSHIKLIETDTATNSGVTPFGQTGGLAIGQAAGSYGNFSDASLSGTYVFGVTGVDLYMGNFIPSTWTAASLFAADGNGNLTNGFTDTFLQLNCVQATCKKGAELPGAQISASFTGTYSVDSASSSCGATSGTVVSGTGRACPSPDPSSFNPAPSPSYRPEFFFYLTGLGAGQPAALVLAVGDPGPQADLHYPSLGTGIAYQQVAPLTFGGSDGLDYGFSITQVNSSGESDGTAQMNANPTATPAVTGVVDLNQQGSPDTATQFTGTLNTPDSNGRFQGSFVGTDNTVLAFQPQFNVEYYVIDADHGFFVENDLINATPPEQTGQVSFGYYACLNSLTGAAECQSAPDKDSGKARK